MKYIRFLTIIAILWSSIAASSEKSITLTTLDWEPYIGEKLRNQGYVAEIVREAFRRSGYKVNLKFVPWARAMQLSINGEVDGYFPEYYNEEVKQHSLYSEPFPGGPMGFFKKAGREIRYQSLQDLKPYKIGIVRGYTNTAEFDNANYLKKDEVLNDTLNIRKLLAGRIDLFIADKFVGLYLLEKNLPEKVGQLEFVEPPLEIKELFVCISNKSKNSAQKLADFNVGLKQMSADGTLEKIIKSHGF